MKYLIPLKLVCLVGIAGTAFVASSAATEPAESKVTTPAKITDRSHPDYVRCRNEPVIGSLAKRRRVCLTNREWANAEQQGNDIARQMTDEYRSRPGGN